jgi:hypothetical protein
MHAVNSGEPPMFDQVLLRQGRTNKLSCGAASVDAMSSKAVNGGPVNFNG